MTRARGVGLMGVPYTVCVTEVSCLHSPVIEKLHGRGGISGSLFVEECASPTCKAC